MTDAALESVRQAHDRLTRARTETADAEVDLQASVRTALEAGVSAVEVARLLGVTRQRVYQLRDGRR